jgi:hypothetical protein
VAVPIAQERRRPGPVAWLLRTFSRELGSKSGRRHARPRDGDEEVNMSTLMFPSMVRDQVLEQHAALRGLLVEAEEELGRSRSASREDGRLRAIGRALCDRFAEHLLFEERELVPVLAEVDSWGPERVRDIHLAHARQRRKLEALWQRLELEPDSDAVALALSDLADDMLRDMEAEEQGCLCAEAMSAVILERP